MMLRTAILLHTMSQTGKSKRNQRESNLAESGLLSDSVFLFMQQAAFQQKSDVVWHPLGSAEEKYQTEGPFTTAALLAQHVH